MFTTTTDTKQSHATAIRAMFPGATTDWTIEYMGWHFAMVPRDDGIDVYPYDVEDDAAIGDELRCPDMATALAYCSLQAAYLRGYNELLQAGVYAL
jgi:hypothetical protein